MSETMTIGEWKAFNEKQKTDALIEVVQENNNLKRVLKFYADKSKYTQCLYNPSGKLCPSDVQLDNGERAREALKEVAK